jgi:superoxide dismutase, Cu-Zn family
MMRRMTLGLLLLAGACSSQSHPDRVSAAPPRVTVTTQLLGANGELRGTASLAQTTTGTRVTAQVSGLAPGVYAIHLHSIGLCTAPDFKSAGGHFNPTAHQHGSLNPMGPHMGDLPNIEVGADGNGALDATIAGLMLKGGTAPLLDADGASIVLHAGPDDYKTDPSGNSGARIACGTLAPAN